VRDPSICDTTAWRYGCFAQGQLGQRLRRDPDNWRCALCKTAPLGITLSISGGAQRRPLHAVVELNPPAADSRTTPLIVRFAMELMRVAE